MLKNPCLECNKDNVCLIGCLKYGEYMSKLEED